MEDDKIGLSVDVKLDRHLPCQDKDELVKHLSIYALYIM